MPTPRLHTFPTPEPIQLSVEIPAGDIFITTATGGESQVTLSSHLRGGHGQVLDRTTVHFSDGRLRVAYEGRRFGRSGSLRVGVSIPAQSSVRIRAASSDVRINVPVDSLEIDTASGDMRVEQAQNARLKTVSGDVRIRSLGSTSSIRTVSGDLAIGRVGEGHFTLNTVSGDIEVGVARGAVAHLSLSTVSGDIDNTLPCEDNGPADGVPLEIQARTVSGDIDIVRATAPKVA